MVKSLLFRRVVQTNANLRAALDSGFCSVGRCVYKVVLGFKIFGLKLVLQKENANHAEGAKVVATFFAHEKSSDYAFSSACFYLKTKNIGCNNVSVQCIMAKFGCQEYKMLCLARAWHLSANCFGFLRNIQQKCCDGLLSQLCGKLNLCWNRTHFSVLGALLLMVCKFVIY